MRCLPPPGQALAAVVSLQEGWVDGTAADGTAGGPPTATARAQALTLPGLQAWLADWLPRHQVPTVLRVVPALPRNAMGKVNKKELRKQLFGV